MLLYLGYKCVCVCVLTFSFWNPILFFKCCKKDLVWLVTTKDAVWTATKRTQKRNFPQKIKF